MDIIKPDLNFREPLTPISLLQYDSIALHHLRAATATVYDIHDWHYNRYDTEDGRNVYWKGIGYGWYIRKNGTIYQGRGFNLNSGVEKENGHVISVAFEGDYQTIDRSMPDEQYNSGIDLINWLKTQLPKVIIVDGHNRWTLTECPGKYFPLQELKTGNKRIQKIEVKKVEEKSIPIQQWEKDAASFLVAMGFFDKLHDPREQMTIAMAGKMATGMVKWLQDYVHSVLNK